MFYNEYCDLLIGLCCRIFDKLGYLRNSYRIIFEHQMNKGS